MRKDIFYYLKIAGDIALRGDPRRSFFLGAVGIRKDGAMVYAYNSPTPKPDRRVHAESRIARRLDVGAVVYVARMLRRGEMAMARPCSACEKALRSRGVKRVYYTISDNEFGILDL